MKNSLKMGLLALSIITTVAPADAATKHSTDKHFIQHVTHKKTKHKHYKHRLSQSHIVNDMSGVASWYGYESGPRFRHQPKTASGVIFNPRKLTAAHKSFPFGAKIKVTNLKNHRAVVVEINDRGPYAHHRIIDLSKAAALAIGMEGVQKVSLNRI